MKRLYTPFKVNKLELKNRVIMSPMSIGHTVDGFIMDDVVEFYKRRAQGGVGLIIFANMQWDKLRYNPNHGAMLTDEKYIPSLKKLTDAIHEGGSKVFAQLMHRGRCANRASIQGEQAVAPSPIPGRFTHFEMPKELTVEEIKEFVDWQAEAAVIAKKAGFDGIEIETNSGYLYGQFFSPLTNHRTDEYGGSFENRYRFAVEVVQAIKKACGDDFPVSLRYSIISKTKGFRQGALPGEAYTEVGRDMAESEKAVKYLQDAGYDCLNCDNGTYDAWYWAHPPIYMPENCNLEDVEYIKQFCDIPVICAGRLDPRVAADAIKEGKLDGAGFARQFLADQEWVTKMMNDEEDDIRPCILCHNGCFNMCHYKGVPNDQELSDSLHLSRCAINAETMQWNKHYIKKTNSPKTVHIVGGGIGGMEAARVLKLRGHNPIIHEKSDVLGGTFIPASAESYKGKLRDLLDWYRRQMTKLGIEVRLNDEIKDIAAFGSDPVIIATGSTPRLLRRVPGYEKMIEGCDYLNGAEVGNTVAVIGGGLTGCEIAYELALQGKNPIIVEMKDDLISQTGVCLANSSYLREWFALHKTPVYLETTLKEVKDGSIVCTGKDGKDISIDCDSVISCAGYIPAPLAEKSGNVHLVGDCLAIGNLRSVVWRAYDVAMKI